MRPTTLTFPIDGEGRLLLGVKKRGFGAGKYNGFGGKLEVGESFRQCAVRELAEESGLLTQEGSLECVAFLDFQFPASPELSHVGYVYFTKTWDGQDRESDEMEPHWLLPHQIPYESMWQGDRAWLPLLLEGKKISGTITFADDNEAVAHMDLEEVDSIDEYRMPQWVSLLLDWYDHNKRDLPWRDCGDPYKVWVSEIMSQQTRIEAMKPYYANWMEQFPDLETLAQASEDQVVHAWQGLGYYSRARNLRLGVQEVVASYNGQVPRDRKAMESLKGVGAYTAGAVLSMAYGQREAAVDGNVLRIYARLYGVDRDILSTRGRKEITALVNETLPYDRPGDFNQALMDFGSVVCIPKVPRCSACPVSSFCQAFQTERTQELPVRIVKSKQKEIPLVVTILRYGSYYLLHKRPNQGLLRSMWEFPSVELPDMRVPNEGMNEEEKTKALTLLCQRGFQHIEKRIADLHFTVDFEGIEVRRLIHVFSHRKWHMHVYRGELSSDLSMEELVKRLPLDWMLLSRADFAAYAWAGPHGKLTELCR